MTTPLLLSRTPSRSQPHSYAQATIAVVGLGYVGLPLAITATRGGRSVIGFDIDAGKVARIASRTVPFLNEAESRALAEAKTLTVATDPNLLKKADALIICVPTPVSDTHEPDLRPLVAAAKTVAAHMKRGALVVVESTVNPGACETVVLPLLERGTRRVERDFYFAHCPERINPGDARWNVATLPRVLGASGPHSLTRAKALYESIIDAPLTALPSIKEAEAVKMVENAFRDINIAFVNELAMSFDRAGIDLISVLRGASTKPFAFMPHFPGVGVGGHCIPVDPYYLIRYGHENGFEHRFLKTARTINNRMPQYAVSVLSKALRRKRKQLARSKIALLGLAYKRDIPDMRESPACAIRDLLARRGTVVRVFDPFVPEHSTASSLDEALQDVDAVLIATDHSDFRALTPFHFMRAGVDIVVDGRNCLRKEDFISSGIQYCGIGRGGV